jgi:hypothetical protein
MNSPQRLFGLLILGLAFIGWGVGCKQESPALSPPAVLKSAPIVFAQVAPIPPEPLPDFLYTVAPKPGEILSLHDYYGSEYDLYPRLGPAVCVTVSPLSLLEPGDYWEANDVVERTTVKVDGEVQDEPIGEFENYAVEHTLGAVNEAGNWTGTVVASAGGPYRWCLETPLGAGVHQAEVNFEKSSGEVVSFAWTFELVEGEVAQPTPLPVATEADRVGVLPDYVEAVYPLPGERIRLPASWGEWRYFPKQPICVSLKLPKLKELGSLPKEPQERVYLGVSDSVSPWVNGITYTNNTIRLCAETFTPPGEFLATLYVVPFDSELMMYSWAFTVEE